MKKLENIKVGIFGDGAWATNLVHSLNKHPNYQTCFIVKRYKTGNERLELCAKEFEIPFFEFKNVNSKTVINLLSAFEADIFLSMSFDQIIKKELLQTPNLGFLNCHAGRLPFYRGRNALNWAIINGENEFGITVHLVDEGIDTGPIVLQRAEKINPDDDYATLLGKAHTRCPLVMIEAIDKFIENPSDCVNQHELFNAQSYFSKRTIGDEWIDWSNGSQQIHNLVRGISFPGPCARTILDGRTIAILKTKLASGFIDYLGTCGQVIGRNQDGVLVKTGDNVLFIEEYCQVSATGKLDPARRADIAVGTVLGYRINHEIYEINKKIEELHRLIREQ